MTTSNKFQNWLLSGLTAAFLGWSAAIWNAIDNLEAMYAELQALRVEVTHMNRDLEKHEATPYHRRAGELLNEMRGRNAK